MLDWDGLGYGNIGSFRSDVVVLGVSKATELMVKVWLEYLGCGLWLVPCPM